ncbi:hypothetical protein Droror1_Dr00022273 [Drosera rotundifolia]
MGYQSKYCKRVPIQVFYVLCISTLSILLPLSFLLLARLSIASFLFSFASTPKPKPSLFLSIFLYTNPTLVQVLLAIITISTFICVITGRLRPVNKDEVAVFRPGLVLSWVLLFMLQVSVGLGIEASIAAKVNGLAFGNVNDDHGRISMLSRLIFFVGVHETMLHWSRMIVHPVVDDTIYGGPKKESWIERAAMAASLGGLWWLKMRNEVEGLVVVVEVKVEMGLGFGVGDFVGWWLYYLTVVIGVARLVKGALWLLMLMFCRRPNCCVETYEDRNIWKVGECELC